MIKKGLGFFISACLGAALTFAFTSNQEEFPFPLLKRQSYSALYDTRAKIPFWTTEHLTSDQLKKTADRTSIKFKEDEEIYPPHRSSLSDYTHSGFDRGHMAPASNASFSEKSLRETFLLSNVSPQDPSLNRGLWAQLERSIRLLADHVEWVRITTGPLFLSTLAANGKRYVTYQVIGKNEVAVPTHFFKVIETPEKKWAYVVPNEPTTGRLSQYLVSIQALEKISGLRLSR